MADIQPFRGLRYDLGRVGSLSDVIAPPYDVIDPALQDQLYAKHPTNVIRLILNRQEPTDDDHNNRYSRAANHLKVWRDDGTLVPEQQPAVYVYHQVFSYAGQSFTRRGFMARCRLEPFGSGKIYPHEETMPGPKQDRLLLTRACRANLSQIFGLYPDPSNAAQKVLEESVAGQTPLEATDHLGVVHRLWPVSDPAAIAKATSVIGQLPVFIADGHHRYETACKYREEFAAEKSLPADHPANFVLMMFIGMSDPGLIVLPTHRLFGGLPPISSSQLIARLGPYFKTRLAGEGTDLASVVWDEIEAAGDQGKLGLYCAKDDRWVIAQITDAGRKRMAELARDQSEPWRGLGVSILHRLVVDNLLEAANPTKPKYVHLVDEVVEGLESGDYQLAALVMPATVEDIRVISQHGERMPAKSTYFYPKLLSGLVINPLE